MFKRDDAVQIKIFTQDGHIWIDGKFIGQDHRSVSVVTDSGLKMQLPRNQDRYRKPIEAQGNS